MIIITKVIFNNYNDKLKVSMHGQLNGTDYPVLTDTQDKLVISPNSIINIPVENLPLTAFGDLRSTTLSPVAGWTFNYALLPSLINFTGLNLGSYTVANSKITLNTGLLLNGNAKIETIKALRYTPGLGSLVRFVSIFTTGVANSTQIIGIGDDSDGFFFGYNGSTFGILRRRNGVDTWTAQSSWNVDTLDSLGPSGITLDTTKGNVYQIQYQWLGFGMITFYIENALTGSLILVHQMQYANTNTDPSVFNPTLPLMAQVKNSGNLSNISLSTSSAMAFAEGDPVSEAISSRYNYYVESSNALANVLTNIFTLRNKTTFNSKTNRVRITFDFLSTGTDGKKLVYFYLLYNPIILLGTFTDISTNQSVMEVSTNAIYTAGTGKVQLFPPSNSTDSVRLTTSTLNLTLNPGDSVIFQVKSSANVNVSASLSWIEYY